MPFAELAEQPVYYAARGETGAPILFVHGAGSNHLIWNQQLHDLAGRARPYALDLPGHGRSRGDGRRTIREYADVVLRFLDHLEIGKAIVVGHSMGGAIAQTVALDSPHRVLGLGLVGTGARLRVAPAFLNGVLTEFAQTAEKLIDAEFALDADENLKRLSKEQLLQCDPQVAHDDFAACDEFDVMIRVAEIKVPSLVICGLEDRMTPVKYSQYLASNIPNASILILPSAGHMVMVEQGPALSRALEEWMGKLNSEVNAFGADR